MLSDTSNSWWVYINAIMIATNLDIWYQLPCNWVLYHLSLLYLYLKKEKLNANNQILLSYWRLKNRWISILIFTALMIFCSNFFDFSTNKKYRYERTFCNFICLRELACQIKKNLSNLLYTFLLQTSFAFKMFT